MLPRVFLKHPAVSTYLVGGADLMLPGEWRNAFSSDSQVLLAFGSDDGATRPLPV